MIILEIELLAVISRISEIIILYQGSARDIRCQFPEQGNGGMQERRKYDPFLQSVLFHHLQCLFFQIFIIINT